MGVACIICELGCFHHERLNDVGRVVHGQNTCRLVATAEDSQMGGETAIHELMVLGGNLTGKEEYSR